ncbi:MAG: sulfite exporter TauE/SafE family protein, partial [Chitinophagia bacterium]|nr:sulfite exporter TauE/SafE family protein [Chitinophagia bacterium]
MEMQIADILISLLGGFTAGFLNALAGFGSVITLAIYMDIMNIPGHIANGTNRV